MSHACLNLVMIFWEVRMCRGQLPELSCDPEAALLYTAMVLTCSSEGERRALKVLYENRWLASSGLTHLSGLLQYCSHKDDFVA